MEERVADDEVGVEGGFGGARVQGAGMEREGEVGGDLGEEGEREAVDGEKRKRRRRTWWRRRRRRVSVAEEAMEMGRGRGRGRRRGFGHGGCGSGCLFG